ncbi:cation:proton antiporter [Congregibacter litoralis]|uniref:Sodium/proton antiporter, CPA1 family n=1 Tax=Congregibacter litoralis KT71 TaxID=314285 RepID=A4ABF8_9GAMM|nr:sodium:proton antiporter [Congregibacter litoralis]EAQ96712.1 sodium/proton antiporter, CPA1 family [Congregibacter litoralis KT71]
MIAIVVEEILALVGLVLLAALLRRFGRLDMSLACILVGFVAGQIIATIGFDTGVQAKDLQDIVFYIILPVLVFEAAWHLDARLLRRWLWPVMLLATLGIVITTVIAAGLSYLGLQDPAGFPWVAALLTGAILSATDPVSVIDQLKAARAPADLGTLFEGESLFNDATAVVLFSLVLTMALSPEVMHANGVSLFTAIFIGGACLGLVTGLLASILLLVLGRPASTTIVLLFTAFGSFFLAEHFFHVSGIMAVMVAALIARGFLKEVEETVASGLTHTWEWSSELLNSILFVIMGLVITLEMFQAHWLAMLIAIGAAVIARLCAVAACGVLTGLTGRRIPRPWQFIMVWGGQRGVIALALALALPLELGYGDTIQSMVFGVILFSLLVQGTTTAALIKRWAPERRLRVRD